MSSNVKCLILAAFCFSLAMPASACGNHLYLNPDNMGFLAGTMVRLSGLAPPEPVFKLDYKEMMHASVGEPSEVIVHFTRPFFSKNVKLQVGSSSRVKFQQEQFFLEERNGAITLPYEASKAGLSTITITVSGTHKGKTVSESSKIYISARAKPQVADTSVSGI